MMTELPVIDVWGLTSDELSTRARVAAQLGHACREIGFFYVVNHGIAETTRAAMFAAARDSLPCRSRPRSNIRSSARRITAAMSRSRGNVSMRPPPGQTTRKLSISGWSWLPTTPT